MQTENQPTPEQQLEIANTRIAVLAQQRNAAMDQAAFWQAQAVEFQTKYEKLQAEKAKTEAVAE